MNMEGVTSVLTQGATAAAVIGAAVLAMFAAVRVWRYLRQGV